MFSLLTLGRLSLYRDGQSVPGFDTQRKGLALLAILAAEGQVSRDRLMALLWPESDTERARGSLKQTIHQLRQLLGAPNLVQGSGMLSLDAGAIETDVGRFVAALERDDLVGAVEVYAGPFLDGVHFNGSAELDYWAETRRAELTRRWAGAVERLATEAEARGDPSAAAEYWQRLQAREPTDSRVMVRLMLALEAAGRRGAALQEAREHQRRLREEWELTPDTAVEELAERLQAAPARSVSAPASLYAERGTSSGAAGSAGRPVAGEHLAPHTRPVLGRPLLTIGVLLLLALGLGAVRLLQAPPATSRPAPDPNLVVVAPFQVSDASLVLWREGLADMLIRDLDGAGPLRTVSAPVAFRNWPGGTDRGTAAALGQRTGAALVVYGSVVRLDEDSVALRASLLDRVSDRLHADLEVRGPEQSMGRLADSLVVRIIGALGRDRPIASARRVSIGARSLPALRAYLRAEQFYRHGGWDSALVHYELAIIEDPNFALALRRMAVVMSWGPATTPSYGDHEEYRRRALALNRGLAPRDSLVFLSDSLYVASRAAVDPVTLVRDQYHAMDVLEEAARRYPGDPDIWYELGEGLYHLPPPLGGPPERTLEAFDRAIALDPDFGPAYEHAVELAFQVGQPARAAQYARAGGALASAYDPSTLRLVAFVLDSGIGALTAAKALGAASPEALRRLGTDHLGWATDSAEAAITVLRELLDPRQVITQSGPLIADPILRPRHLAVALAFRGHLRAAAELGTAEPSRTSSARAAAMLDPFLELALFGAVPESIASRAFNGSLSPAAEWSRPADATPPRHLRGAPWWLARRDTMALRRFAAQASRAASNAASPVAVLRGRYFEAVGTAYLTLARGDSLRAAQLLEAIPDTLCLVALCSYEKVTLARLLVARGEYRQAADLLDRWGATSGGNAQTAGNTPSAVLAALDHARVAERLADTSMARKRYRFVSQVWRRADPELQPYVTEARAGLARLAQGGDGR